eukprot:CAMPEP_0198202598 /NCGR_PEP_ID=MMETSP1445-20131203/5787_1 /TAXON_ID=36898 /ORGANISM="Pyramimonas sp., Strain CCMP2087" /LENGTH=423 /DNA_ID=CAMNT_0043873603 /DNA_START=134 /DNA_END=1405 /DNA_ORIENTATION=-
MSASKPTNRTAYPTRELLEDLSIRFVVNAPTEELQDFERMLFLIEKAHWFYEDNVRPESLETLKSLSLLEFAECMFRSCDTLKPYEKHVAEIYKKFNAYKHTVPVHGAIILNCAMDRVLLVQGFKANSTWGFPKGKINKDERECACAAREVEEEIGFDVSGRLVEEDYLEATRGGQYSRLYIIPDVPESTCFMTHTKGEIGMIAWHDIAALPTSSNVKNADGLKYFLVGPFINPLKKWIKAHKKGDKKGSKSNSNIASSNALRTSSETLLSLLQPQRPKTGNPKKVDREATDPKKADKEATNPKKADKEAIDKKAAMHTSSSEHLQSLLQPQPQKPKPESASQKANKKSHKKADADTSSSSSSDHLVSLLQPQPQRKTRHSPPSADSTPGAFTAWLDFKLDKEQVMAPLLRALEVYKGNKEHA